MPYPAPSPCLVSWMYSLMMIIYWHYYGFYWHSISIRLQTIDTWLLDFRLRHDFNNNKILLSSHSCKCIPSLRNLLCISLLDANAENKYQSTVLQERKIEVVWGWGLSWLWMLDDAMSRIMSRADRDLGLKYPLPISSPHRSGDNVHIQTKLRFRYSAFSTPNLGDLCPHTQGSEIDTD